MEYILLSFKLIHTEVVCFPQQNGFSKIFINTVCI